MTKAINSQKLDLNGGRGEKRVEYDRAVLKPQE